MFGAGREEHRRAARERCGSGFARSAQQHGRPIYASARGRAPAGNERPIVVADAIDVRAATLRALETAEAIGHGLLPRGGVGRAHRRSARGPAEHRDFDKLIAEVESRVDLDDTLLLFTADHSFGLQVDGGKRGAPLCWRATTPGRPRAARKVLVRLENVMVNDSHTAEEVPVLAIGVGAERVRGYFPNTLPLRSDDGSLELEPRCREKLRVGVPHSCR
jgi:alkaline phosphatase